MEALEHDSQGRTVLAEFTAEQIVRLRQLREEVAYGLRSEAEDTMPIRHLIFLRWLRVQGRLPS